LSGGGEEGGLDKGGGWKEEGGKRGEEKGDYTGLGSLERFALVRHGTGFKRLK